jgi:hypothetical protein
MAAPAGPAAPRPLPASLRHARITIRGDTSLFGTDMDDPGILRTEATVTIHDLPEEDSDLGEEAAAEIEGISLDPIRQASEGPEMTIFRATALTMDFGRVQDPHDSLDADSQELESYACLFDLPGSELHPDLLVKLEFPASQHIVIMERARLAPAWRGCGGIGRYLTGRVLPWICPSPAVVVGQPFPIDVPRHKDGTPDNEAFGPAMKQIERVWKSIGFEPYKNGIWIMDPSLNTHQRAIARLERKLGLG